MQERVGIGIVHINHDTRKKNKWIEMWKQSSKGQFATQGYPRFYRNYL